MEIPIIFKLIFMGLASIALLGASLGMLGLMLIYLTSNNNKDK